MANIIPFTFDKLSIRIVIIENAKSYPVNLTGQVRNTKLIPESDVWRLIIKSRLSEAEKIEKWIFEEVLPAIRKTGKYSMSKRTDLISISVEDMRKELEALKFILDNFNLSEKEKISYTNQTLHKINFQTLENPYLKKLEPVFSLTDLLKEFEIYETAHQFNLKLESFGIIERQENGWQIVNMKYGRNLPASFGNNPKYYKSTFQELLDL